MCAKKDTEMMHRYTDPSMHTTHTYIDRERILPESIMVDVFGNPLVSHMATLTFSFLDHQTKTKAMWIFKKLRQEEHQTISSHTL